MSVLESLVDQPNYAVIKLTDGIHESLVDLEDYEYLSKWNWNYDINNKGSHRSEYHDGKTVSFILHRVIMGNPKGLEVDHINHDRLDNRKENLRVVTHKENHRNRRKSKNNTTGFIGVSMLKNRNKKYVANISPDGRQISLGYFYTAEEAAIRYDEEAIKLGFLSRNFP